MQAVIDACEKGDLDAEVAAVVSSNVAAGGIERAAKYSIPTYVFANKEDRDEKVLAIAKEKGVDLIVLAGYLGIISQVLINEYKNGIINIHPSLLPHHGGKGMHGIKVHESVIKSGDKASGATVHFVNERIDEGDIILQKEVVVSKDWGAEELQKSVLAIEHELIVAAIKKII